MRDTGGHWKRQVAGSSLQEISLLVIVFPARLDESGASADPWLRFRQRKQVGPNAYISQAVISKNRPTTGHSVV